MPGPLGPVIALLMQSASPPSTSRPTVAEVLDLPTSASYAPASYVKWLEMAGARVSLVPYDADDTAVDKAFGSTNGALFIGGGSSTPGAARRFYANMLAAKAKGDTYPIWGTCDGFEWLMQIGAEDNGVLTGGFDAENLSLPLNLTAAASSSRLLADAAQMPVQGSSPRLSILEALTTLPLTLNNHMQGVAPADFQRNAKLPSTFSVLATNVDRTGRAFVSVVEGRDNLPVWATQWHPEKNIFEQARAPGAWYPYEAISHTRAAVAIAQYMATFFVDQCRNSTHRFATPADEWDRLVYRRTTSTVMRPGFEQIYVVTGSSVEADDASDRGVASATERDP